MDDVSAIHIGHNNPPAPTPFELSRDEIELLVMEARNWADGTGVETQMQADAVGKLINDLRAAAKTADARRVEEKKPFDDAAAAVQARYNPLIQKDKGKTDLAIASCKAILAPYLKKLDDIKQAEIKAAREEAELVAKQAREAMEARRQNDLTSVEAAEALAAEAKQLEAYAKRTERISVAAKGGGRSVSLRTVYRTELSDLREAARHYWQERKTDFEAVLLKWAEQDVAAGKRAIPGFTITEDKVAV